MNSSIWNPVGRLDWPLNSHAVSRPSEQSLCRIEIIVEAWLVLDSYFATCPLSVDNRAFSPLPKTSRYYGSFPKICGATKILLGPKLSAYCPWLGAPVSGNLASSEYGCGSLELMISVTGLLENRYSQSGGWYEYGIPPLTWIDVFGCFFCRSVYPTYSQVPQRLMLDVFFFLKWAYPLLMSAATSKTIIFPFNLSSHTSHIEVGKSVQLFCGGF